MIEPPHTLREFEQLGTKEICRWFKLRCEKYLLLGGPSYLLDPFAEFVRSSNSPAEAIAKSLKKVSHECLVKVGEAIVDRIAHLPSTYESKPLWLFYAEFSWWLSVSEAIDMFERRCTDAFLEEVFCGETPAPGSDFDRLFGFFLAEAPRTKAAVELFYRLVQSKLFNQSQARNTLVRLCEIAPDGWTEHVGLLRGQMKALFDRKQARDGLEGRIEAEVDTTRDIRAAIGSQRFLAMFEDLDIMAEPGLEDVCDNWIIRAAFERDLGAGTESLEIVMDGDTVKVWAQGSPGRKIEVDPARRLRRSSKERLSGMFSAVGLPEEDEAGFPPRQQVDRALGEISISEAPEPPQPVAA